MLTHEGGCWACNIDDLIPAVVRRKGLDYVTVMCPICKNTYGTDILLTALVNEAAGVTDDPF